MATIQEKLEEIIPVLQSDTEKLLKKLGTNVISEVTVKQAYGGMRGVKSMICETSSVDPDKGVLIRGKTIPELQDKLPEEVFYLLCTGELPDADSLKSLQNDLSERSEVPEYVFKIIDEMSEQTHPMRMLSIAVLALGRDSVFSKKYDEGMSKADYWKAALEDSLTLLARLPEVAAAIYRSKYKLGARIDRDPELDWGGNFGHMLGIGKDKPEFYNMIRMFLSIHSDHEGGNVSAFTSHVVGSALSDPFYAVSSGYNGLAGPLHGLANQECLKFITGIRDKFNGVPTEKEFEEYCWEILKSGKVIPGYGHAVLRVTDPRFTALYEFGKRVCPDDEIFRIVDMGYSVIPKVLKAHGKAKSPMPNVDAGSGAIIHHFGLEQTSYYTVLFSVSRALGLLSQLIISRALYVPITRPKSVSLKWISDRLTKSESK